LSLSVQIPTSVPKPRILSPLMGEGVQVSVGGKTQPPRSPASLNKVNGVGGRYGVGWRTAGHKAYLYNFMHVRDVHLGTCQCNQAKDVCLRHLSESVGVPRCRDERFGLIRLPKQIRHRQKREEIRRKSYCSSETHPRTHPAGMVSTLLAGWLLSDG
jgi:hypothetical protein